ncbi:hypothetical protein Efla_000105 [Eimeria flavescens]
MGAYLSSPLSSKEVASGGCPLMGLRWGVCSMQGWRIAMEDAHLVLYAKRSGPPAAGAAAAAAGAAGKKPHAARLHPQLQQQQEEEEEEEEDAGEEETANRSRRPTNSSTGQHLVPHFVLGLTGGGRPFHRQHNEGFYVFLPVAEKEGTLPAFPSDAAAAAPLPPTSAAAAAAGEEEAAGDSGETGAGEAAEGEGAGSGQTAHNRKTSKLSKSVLRQFGRRKRAPPAAAAAAGGAACSNEAEAQGEGPPQSPPLDAAAVAAGIHSNKGTLSLQADSQPDLCIFAVFDGHGGAHVSRFAAAHLQALLETQPSFHKGDFAAALRGAYLQIDELLRQDAAQDELLYLTTHTPYQLQQHKQLLHQLQQQQQQHPHHSTHHQHQEQQQQQQQQDGEAAALPQHKGLRSTLSTIGQHLGVRSQPSQQQQQQQQQRASSSCSGESLKQLRRPSRPEDGDDSHLNGLLQQQAAGETSGAVAAAAAAAAAHAASSRSSSKGEEAVADGRTLRSENTLAAAAGEADPHAAAAAGAAAAAAGAAAAAAEDVFSSLLTIDELVSPRKSRRGSFGGFVDAFSRSFGLSRFFGKSHSGSNNSSKSLASTAGCTALTVCVTPTSIVVANVGDSRCVLCRGADIIELSQDHKPQLAEERIRIYAAGGYLEMGRVNGNLNLSRALGDLAYKADCTLPPEKQILSGAPDVVSVQRDLQRDEFLVIGCDGIWELLSSAEVAEFVRRRIDHTPDLCQILKDLFDSLLSPNPALFEFGCDNMTAFIVDLKAEQRQPAAAAAACMQGEEQQQQQQQQCMQAGSVVATPPDAEVLGSPSAGQGRSLEGGPASSEGRGPPPAAAADATLQQQQPQQEQQQEQHGPEPQP